VITVMRKHSTTGPVENIGDHERSHAQLQHYGITAFSSLEMALHVTIYELPYVETERNRESNCTH